MHISVSPSHPKDSDEDAGIQLMLTKVGVNLSALFSAKSSAPTASKFITKLSHLTMPPRTSDQAGSAAGLNAGVVVAHRQTYIYIYIYIYIYAPTNSTYPSSNTHSSYKCVLRMHSKYVECIVRK